MAIYPFLTFNGNCEEAMRFYQSCFGGELHLCYLQESPHGNAFPLRMQRLIVQATLVTEHIRIFATDLGGGEGHYAGNSISLLISLSEDDGLKKVFKRLSRKGEVTTPLSARMHKGEWATLTDRYAVQWIFELK